MNALLLLIVLGNLFCPSKVSTLDVSRTCTGWETQPACATFWRYDTVFIGTVKTLVSEPFPEGQTYDWQHFRRVTATLTVDETFRGKLGSEIVFEMADCYFQFVKGEKYLIYANKGKDGKFDLRRTSSPSRLLSEASEDLGFIRSLPGALPGGRIFGDVYDHRESVTLRVNSEPYPPSSKMPGVTIYLRKDDMTYETISDAMGHYEFTGVPAGTYELSTNLPDFLSGSRHTLTVVDKGCLDIFMSIQATGSIKGRLISANGEPIKKAVVSIFSADGVTEDMFDRVGTYYMTRDETDKDGSFSFVRLRSGRYHLAVNLLDQERIQESRSSAYGRIFYPGVASFGNAKSITLADGAKLEHIEIKLPKLANKLPPSP